jgi:hypothetical protein
MTPIELWRFELAMTFEVFDHWVWLWEGERTGASGGVIPMRGGYANVGRLWGGRFHCVEAVPTGLL